MLVTVCRECHEDLEFNYWGYKRTFTEVLQASYLKLTKRAKFARTPFRHWYSLQKRRRSQRGRIKASLVTAGVYASVKRYWT